VEHCDYKLLTMRTDLDVDSLKQVIDTSVWKDITGKMSLRHPAGNKYTNTDRVTKVTVSRRDT